MRWALASFVLVLAAVGCSNDFGSLYRGTAKTADSGAPSAAMPEPLPVLPALPDEDRIADCERCAKSTCGRARADCLEDDNCVDELRCKGTCSDPACLQTCSAEHGWSLWYADYSNCVFGQCPSECNTGNNWKCRGNYDWPAADPKASSFAVKFRFTTPPTFFLGSRFPNALVGTTIRACSDDRECEAPIDSDKVGVDNAVELELVADVIQPKDFRGCLEIDGGFGGEHERFYTAPLAQSQEYFAGFLGSGSDLPGIDHQRAWVFAIVTDCLVAPVAGARVTLPQVPAVEAFRLESTTTWSVGLTSSTGVAALINLPDSAADNKLRVRAEQGKTGELISERAIWVRPGFQTRLALGPAARSD